MTTSALNRLTVLEPGPSRPPSHQRRIGIVGTGYVGLVTGACLAELGHSVVCLDSDSSKIGTLRLGGLPFFEPQLLEIIASNSSAGRLLFSQDVATGIRESEIVVIAVGTPMRHDDGADLSAVWDVAATIRRELNGPKTVVIKSTVPVDTAEMVSAIIAESGGLHRVDVVSNPEFLREGSAVTDFMHPDRIVIGTSSPHAAAMMRDLYAPLDAPLIITDCRTSEMIKYAANAFLATKVSLMNEIANICDVVDVDVEAVAGAISFDRRIGTQFMNPGIGYGGSCFPKDLRALERTASLAGYSAVLLRSVETVNRIQIPRALAKIEKALGRSIKGDRVCVLGLSFKPNTSDVREAPALNLIDLLLGSGASVTAHDPIAIESARAKTGPAVTYCTQMYEAINGCDVLVLATEWDEYRRIDFRMVRKLMRGDIVFDGRNIFNATEVAAEGLRYIGVGRAKEPNINLAYADAQ
jgi:UDPglucose 6-dehydrogenase